MDVYTLFSIAISLLVYNSLANSTPQCSKLQVTIAECQKAGQKIVYSKNNGGLSVDEWDIAVSSGRCLVQVLTLGTFVGIPKADIDNTITEIMKACPQGGRIEKTDFTIIVHEVEPNDRLYGTNASPDGKVVCTNDAPVRMEDCFQAVQAIPLNNTEMLNSSPGKPIINSAGTCTIKVHARSRMRIAIEKKWLLNAVSKSADKKQGSSLIEACTIQNTNTAHPAYMVQTGVISRPNQRVLIETLFNAQESPGGSKP